MKFIFVFLLLTLFLTTLVQCNLEELEAENHLEAIVSNLPKKYCPMRDFDGRSYCPSSKESIQYVDDDFISPHQNSMMSLEGDVDSMDVKPNQSQLYDTKATPRILSGFGYDRVKREIRYPVLPTHNAKKTNKHQHTAKKFGFVKDYLNYIFGGNKGYFESGLYVLSNRNLKKYANLFGNHKVHIGMTQKHHITHTTNVQSKNPLSEFEQAINSLPPYNPKDDHSKTMYDMVLQFWGTDIALSTQHGGIIFQQSIIKSCYGGSVTKDMIKDIDAAIKKVPPGGMAYLKYRKLGAFNARGGNPEYGMNKIKERIASFGKSPAPLKFTSIPIYQVVKNQQRREWLKRAVSDYIKKNQPNVNQIIAEVEQNKKKSFKKGVHMYMYAGSREQKARAILYATGCPRVKIKGGYYTPHCNVRNAKSLPDRKLAAGQNTKYKILKSHVILERHPQTGYARFRAAWSGATTDWAKGGCHRLWIPIRWGRYIFKKHFGYSFCMECTPIVRQKKAAYGLTHTHLDCVCPQF